MGGVSSRQRAKYAEKLEAWENKCAAIDAEEAEARLLSTPGSCRLTLYWLQSLAGLAELPFRATWHVALLCVAQLALSVCYLQELAFGGAVCLKWAAHQVSHHAMQLRIYAGCSIGSASHMLCFNLKHPSNPFYVYTEDVSLNRPLKPADPEAGCLSLAAGCFGGCGDGCGGCDGSAQLLFKQARSMLCVFGGPRASCHPAGYAGPCPESCGCETQEARWQRWAAEVSGARAARTAAFEALYDAEPGAPGGGRYLFARTASGKATALIVTSGGDGDGSAGGGDDGSLCFGCPCLDRPCLEAGRRRPRATQHVGYGSIAQSPPLARGAVPDAKAVVLQPTG